MDQNHVTPGAVEISVDCPVETGGPSSVQKFDFKGGINPQQQPDRKGMVPMTGF